MSLEHALKAGSRDMIYLIKSARSIIFTDLKNLIGQLVFSQVLACEHIKWDSGYVK